MNKLLRGIFVSLLICLALAGLSSAYIINTQHLSFDSATTNSIVANRGDLIILKKIPGSNAKPVIVKTVPVLGNALNFLRQPMGLVLAIYLPALFIIIAEIKHLANRSTKRVYDANLV